MLRTFLLWTAAASLATACSLNPQPLPPSPFGGSGSAAPGDNVDGGAREDAAGVDASFGHADAGGDANPPPTGAGDGSVTIPDGSGPMSDGPVDAETDSPLSDATSPDAPAD